MAPPKKKQDDGGFCMVDAYLILYNSVACAGWAMVLSLSLLSLRESLSSGAGLFDSLAEVYSYKNVGMVLFYSQSMALLEIAHAALKLAKSPVVPTTLQVMSRIVALYAIHNSENCQNQWGGGIMMISWASVEVPRYLFYVMAIISGDSTKGTPYPLFWLRYSLFAVLYPTGITGELSVFFKAAADLTNFGTGVRWYYGTFLPIVYFFGSPYMIFNMIGNRKRSMKKRFAKPKPPPRGIAWPKDDKGGRSSTPTNKAILGAAVGAVNPELGEKIVNAKGYRFTYVKYLEQMVKEQCKSPEAALKVAQAGLDKAYELFEFIAPDGSAVPFKEAMETNTDETFCTGFIQGEAAKVDNVLKIPYKGKELEGQALIDQVNKWVKYGTIEPSAGEAIINVVNNPEWVNVDLKDRYFVLLGAGSAMGPFLVLMALGANVIAVDLDRPQIWKRLISIAKKSSGSITFPLKKEQSSYKSEEEMYSGAGCNLFTHTPIIRNWLLGLHPDNNMTIGSYAYLDGALHVQVSLAMDAICKDLTEKRDSDKTSLAYLCTPTDLHLIPEEAHNAANLWYLEYIRDPYSMAMRLLSNGKFLRKNPMDPILTDDNTFFYVNGISVAQGPNYALAKRMQHWRSVTAFNKQKCTVSTNIAPSTSTASVLSNITFAWAYEGMPYFKPYEIFAPETSNAVMSAILFNDINNEKSNKNPKTKTYKNPNQLFSYGSFHGGVWRCAFTIDSVGESSVLLYFSRVAAPYVVALAGVGMAAGIMLSK